MNVLFHTACVVAVFSVYVGSGTGLRLPEAKALTVDCKSLGDNEEFKHRVMQRSGAEDNITILLYKNEELSIHFHMLDRAILEVLDIRYSNDGGEDVVQVTLDDVKLGEFKTQIDYKWGERWNRFESSGSIGGHRYVASGNHKLTLTILEGDQYGIEIDYIRFNVHGSKMDHMDEEFMCVHNPSNETFL